MSRVAVESWITVDKAKELFTAAGQDFDALKKAALSKDFKPVPLNAKANFTIKNTLREVAFDQRRSPSSKAPIRSSKTNTSIYTAHWDHLGRDPKLQGDQIFNGALDNASGTAGLLEIAEAFTKLEPRRPNVRSCSWR